MYLVPRGGKAGTGSTSLGLMVRGYRNGCPFLGVDRNLLLSPQMISLNPHVEAPLGNSSSDPSPGHKPGVRASLSDWPKTTISKAIGAKRLILRFNTKDQNAAIMIKPLGFGNPCDDAKAALMPCRIKL